ncbi:hypothetical protein, partial [Escherichia coli]|uniref:hypothetical protein n=1 Tax=Escherichia coli TaxID=562 RepID=UPI0019511B40
MRVEQRIGRIDRLGQRFSDIHIVNLHYDDTVEADVYRALRERISVFERVVGGLQPILTRLPQLIEITVLADPSKSEETRQQATQALDAAIAGGAEGAIDLDEFADVELDQSVRSEPALSLADLQAILDRPALLPAGTEASALDGKDYRLTD